MSQWQIGLAITSLAFLSCACNYLPAGKIILSQPKEITTQESIKKSMQIIPSSKIKVSSSLKLEIWQNDPKRPLSGTSSIGSQLGFATIDFMLENPTEKPITITLEKIEIRSLNSASNEPLMSLPSKSITLGGLEYAPQRYQLSNREGYSSGQVEAIIVYELDGKQYTLRSAAVSVR